MKKMLGTDSFNVRKNLLEQNKWKDDGWRTSCQCPGRWRTSHYLGGLVGCGSGRGCCSVGGGLSGCGRGLQRMVLAHHLQPALARAHALHGLGGGGLSATRGGADERGNGERKREREREREREGREREKKIDKGRWSDESE